MTFDGTQKFTFDAWNRLVKVAHAYRDGSNNVQSGAASITMKYDGRGRRVSKAITNSRQWDRTHKYSYDRDSLIETAYPAGGSRRGGSVIGCGRGAISCLRWGGS